jgi:hypothetical protein
MEDGEKSAGKVLQFLNAGEGDVGIPSLSCAHAEIPEVEDKQFDFTPRCFTDAFPALRSVLSPFWLLGALGTFTFSAPIKEAR